MNRADPYSIVIANTFQGTAIPFTVNFWTTPPDPDATPPVPGVPRDISGWYFMFTLKKAFEDPDPGIWSRDWQIADGTGGSTSWTVPAIVTAAMAAKFQYHWDLKAIVATGVDPQMTLAGTIPLNPAVTMRLVPIP